MTDNEQMNDYLTDNSQDTLQDIISDLAPKLTLNLGSTISKNGIINLIKGDTFSFKFDLNIGTPLQPIIVELGDDDCVILKVMYPQESWNNAVIVKTITKDDVNEDGSVTITFEPSDTVLLNAGVYYYQVKLFIAKQDAEDVIVTLIPKTKLNLLD